MNKYEWYPKEEVIDRQVDFAMRILKAIKADKDNTIGFIYGESDFCSSPAAIASMRSILKTYATYFMDSDVECEAHIENVDRHFFTLTKGESSDE